MTADDHGDFQPYAVTSRTGPHLTMQAGVVQAGRFWTTTAASSLKARSVRAHGHAGAVVVDGDEATIVSGRTVALRPFRPWRALEDPVAGSLWGLAVARLGRTHLDQLFGYLEASGSIPSEWFPTRRVLLVTRIDRSITLRDDAVVAVTGDWSAATASPDRALAPTRRAETRAALPLTDLGDTHRPVVDTGTRAHLAISTPTGPVALPARWLGDDRFSVSAGAITAIDADVDGRGSVTFDRSTSRRPDEKLGVMFRGQLRLDDLVEGRAVLALTPERITTWDGFEADTVDVKTALPA